MGKGMHTKVKKLALAYGTGWEYMPGSEEAGSVLTDIFLNMMGDNQSRYGRIWEKQEQAFRRAVPEYKSHTGNISGELAVKVSGEEHGKWLEEGSEAYVPREQGEPVRFRTLRPLQLTAAKLRYAVYCKGMCAWLTYQEGEEEQHPLALFQPGGMELSHPVFCWYFRGLCDGMADFGFEAVFNGTIYPSAALPGKWTIGSGEAIYPADWKQTDSGFRLEGRTPEFAANLEGELYEIRLELSPEEELTEEWQQLLCGGYMLKAPEEESPPDLCITDSDGGDGGKVLPFGTVPADACCCYLSCDRIMAGRAKEIRLHFRESCIWEEKLPEPRSVEYEKLYKKYPWLRQTETVYEWRPENTLWEYFNGKMWRPLPDSETWQTGCHGEEAGEKAYTWSRPRDMQPCVVEGEKHYYIRLRLCSVRNAYAMYYRKAVPVLEEIRFSAGECRMLPAGQKIPDCREAKSERMYFGFDRDVTPDNCWYTGKGACSFTGEMILGRGARFGREAFWVELAERNIPEDSFTCLLPNYIPVRMEEDAEENAGKPQINKGDSFYFEPYGMGMLEAQCLSDICCEKAGAPILSGRQAGEHYFAHLGRVLTPVDVEMILQERYPMLRVISCIFRRESRILEVELAYSHRLREEAETWLGRKPDPGSLWEEQALLTEQEVCARLPKIESWLEEVLSAEGPVWLRECSVSAVVHRSG